MELFRKENSPTTVGLEIEGIKVKPEKWLNLYWYEILPLLFLFHVSSEPVSDYGWSEDKLASSISPEGKITILV